MKTEHHLIAPPLLGTVPYPSRHPTPKDLAP